MLLEVDAHRALSLLQKARPHVAQNGTAYELARLQLLSAKCRLGTLPPATARSTHTAAAKPGYIGLQPVLTASSPPQLAYHHTARAQGRHPHPGGR